MVADAVPAGAVRDTIAGQRRRAAGSASGCSTSSAATPCAPGTRSLAFTLRLQAADRTLTDDDVATVRTRVIDAVESAHGATLRA